MQEDLKELVLGRKKITDLTGLKPESDYIGYAFLSVSYRILLSPRSKMSAELSASLQSLEVILPLQSITKAIIVFIAAVVNSLDKQGVIRKNIGKNPLVTLMSEVVSYNKVIYSIDVLDQLSSVGNRTKLEDRSTVLKALSITLQSLSQALKTERILRLNPGFRPESFDCDLSALQSLELTEKSGEYAQLLNETLAIGVSMQEEMQELLEA